MILAVSLLIIPQPTHITEGVADFSSFHDITPLNGTWEFYWGELLDPSQEDYAAELAEASKHRDFIRVPGTWTGQPSGSNQPLGFSQYPHQGYATYRALIRYPATIKDPMLKISQVVNAYSVFINGEEKATLGQVSRSLDQCRSDIGHRYVPLPQTDQQVEIVMQVGNLDYTRGGIRNNILFGSAAQILQHDRYVLAIQLMVIGGTLFIGLYYLLVFLMHRNNYPALFFFLLCADHALRASLWGEMPVLMLIPDAPNEVGVFLNYFTGYNLMPLVILFLASLYREEFRRRVVLVLVAPSLLFDLLLVTPSAFYSRFNEIFYVILMAQMLVALILLSRCVLRERPNAFLMLLAIGTFYLTIFNDILGYNSRGFFNMNYLSLYGNVAIIFLMAYIQVKNERTARELREKVMESELAYFQSQIKPHFLYNALNAIANVSEKDGIQGSRLILDLATYLRNRLEYHSIGRNVSLATELESIQTYFNIEKARFGDKIRLELEVETNLNRPVPALILQPLVENAVRHGISRKPGGGMVRLCITEASETERNLQVTIEDDGVGMEESLLNRLRAGEPATEQGVGLVNVQQRLRYLYGSGLKMESREGQGTRIRLELPEKRKAND